MCTDILHDDTDSQEKLENVLKYISYRYIVLEPGEWNELYKLLPQTGIPSSPLPPLILAAWDVTSHLEKIERLIYHIKYAYDNGVFNEVCQYLENVLEVDFDAPAKRVFYEKL